MGELDRCPFCGDRAFKEINVGKYGFYGWIECSLCGAKSRTVKLLDLKEFRVEGDFWSQRSWDTAVHSWNRRVEKVTT